MRIAPISITYNSQVRNNKIENQQRLTSIASDSVSFNAKKNHR